MGIATSGRTPYAIGALEYAKTVAAFTIGFACNHNSAIARIAELMIAPIVGPEVITGSTRLKAGTAPKLVLNMLTTGAMVRIGKTYGNLMVDLRASNAKLVDRSERIVAEICGLDRVAARALLQRAGGVVKRAIVMHLLQVDDAGADAALDASHGVIRRAVDIAPPAVASAPPLTESR